MGTLGSELLGVLGSVLLGSKRSILLESILRLVKPPHRVGLSPQHLGPPVVGGRGMVRGRRLPPSLGLLPWGFFLSILWVREAAIAPPGTAISVRMLSADGHRRGDILLPTWLHIFRVSVAAVEPPRAA